MRRVILIGRSEAGKTTLKQALEKRPLQYEKTQAVDFSDFIIDTPGEYAQGRRLSAALAVYSYEADIIGLTVQANEAFSLFSPNIACMANRDVIGIITKVDEPDANLPQARLWLELAGCEKIFEISSYTGKGIEELLEYLNEEPAEETDITVKAVRK